MANDSHIILKISGYLEKKGKLRVVSQWKKYWFVLEGRLLLYYRSRDEYEAISPCKGSISLCPPCTIKPANSHNCVFQIECRANTVTLKAHDRFEQERWMQALLSAIDQSKSSATRMSHFRYSLDDLPYPVVENKKKIQSLTRQNTMPNRLKTSSQDNKLFIERRLQINTQKYGGSLEIMNKSNEPEKSNRVSPKLPKNKNVSRIVKQNIIEKDSKERENSLYASREVPARTSSLIIENDQYSCAGAENKSENKEMTRREHCLLEERIYERISSDSNSSQNLSGANKACLELSDKPANNSDEHSVDVQYSLPNKIKNKDFVKINSNNNVIPESEYAVPDENVNRITQEGPKPYMVENDQYISSGEITNDCDVYYAEYAVPDKKGVENVYEDPDKFKRYSQTNEICEPQLPPRPEQKRQDHLDETSSQESGSGKKSKGKLTTLQRFAQFVKQDKKTSKKKQSFMHRVWNRKCKSLESKGSDDSLYEAVDYEGAYNQKKKDVVDITLLSELQQILETRKNLLEEKIKHEELQPENNSHLKNTDFNQPNVNSMHKENPEGGPSETDDDSNRKRPLLPIRQKPRNLSPYHDVPKNNKPVQNLAMLYESTINKNKGQLIITEKTIAKKGSKFKSQEKLKTVDEILEDLDKEKLEQETKLKVKLLIEKFNDIQKKEEVILRKKINKSVEDIKPNENVYRHSDELTQLLEELSKITCAPLLQPGVTCSLNTTPLTDDEWLQLIPIRRRRLSEPDYDIPRPHRIQSNKEIKQTTIDATRFFGPILPCSPVTKNHQNVQHDIDPDSLEICDIERAARRKELVHLHNETDTSVSSYTSHNYSENYNYYASSKKIIFCTPKTQSKGIRDCEIGHHHHHHYHEPIEKKTNKSTDVFIDSLETFTEFSTSF